MAVYAVGDIQGCYKSLRYLLDQVSFDPSCDVLWCVGDLVNRGPDSLSTLRFLKYLGDACVCVLGNHDLHLLECASGGRSYKRDSFTELLAADDLPELLDWLRHRPLFHKDKALGWCMLHAGLHPHWSLAKTQKRATVVEAVLRGEHWQSFCQHLHHAEFPSQQPAYSTPKLFDSHSLDEMIFTTAVLTRTRYCTASGVFNWGVRSGQADQSVEKPWFKHPKAKWLGGCRVVYGHWAAKGLVQDQPHVLGLDSGCVWGGGMSLARLDQQKPKITRVASLDGALDL
ncbi:MAG: symmetrical bis(5'-nucleosyl)-tetraphosphatase [Mariprofundaceae bacterium]